MLRFFTRFLYRSRGIDQGCEAKDFVGVFLELGYNVVKIEATVGLNNSATEQRNVLASL
jgi:hypothetical protein